MQSFEIPALIFFSLIFYLFHTTVCLVFSVKNSPGGAILVIFSKQQCVWSVSFLHSKYWQSWNGFFSGSCVLVLAKFLQFLRLFCSSFWNLFSTLQKYMLNVQISPPGASHLWQTAIFVQCFIPSLQQTLVIVERFSFNTVLVLDCKVPEKFSVRTKRLRRSEN